MKEQWSMIIKYWLHVLINVMCDTSDTVMMLVSGQLCWDCVETEEVACNSFIVTPPNNNPQPTSTQTAAIIKAIK